MPDNTELQPAGRDRLRSLLGELQTTLDSDQNPMTRERDHYARLWDDVMQDVMKTLQSIRDDNAAIRRQLRDGYEAGQQESQSLTEGTERILKAIAESTDRIIAEIKGKTAAVKETKRSWW